jgi:dipeptidyl aminopeptidase/acylaminoacyl peptidase
MANANQLMDKEHGDEMMVSIELDDIMLISRYYPANTTSTGPAVLLLHGWDWPDVDPARYMQLAAKEFQRRGYTVLLPTMRGWPPTGSNDDCAGRQVDDALQALTWLAGQPEVDESRLYLSGFSQGGQVALLAAARNAPVRATAAFAPVVDPESWGKETNIEGIREYVMEECGGPEGWAQRSVHSYDAIPGPFLLVHGDEDLRVPTRQSIELYNRHNGKSAAAKIVLLPGSTHDMDEVLQPELAIEYFQFIEVTTD